MPSVWLTLEAVTRDTQSTLALDTAHCPDLVADLYPNTAVFPFLALCTLCKLSWGTPKSGHQVEVSSAHLGCLSSDPFLWERKALPAAARAGESRDHVSQFYTKIPSLLAKHWPSKAYSFLLNQQLKMPVPWAIRWYELKLGSLLLIIARTEKTGRVVCEGLRCQAASLGC